MSFSEYLNGIGLSSVSFWGIMAFVASIGIEVVPKVKWSPWSALFKWIGSKFNDRIERKVSEVDKKIDSVNKKVEELQSELNNHIKESEMTNLLETRRDILEFANSCMNKKKHTQEQYEFIIERCDKYEEYIEKNHIKNGVIESAIREVRRLYDKCRRENAFLKEEED